MNKSKCFAALFMAAVFGLSACAKDPTFVKAASSTNIIFAIFLYLTFAHIVIVFIIK